LQILHKTAGDILVKLPIHIKRSLHSNSTDVRMEKRLKNLSEFLPMILRLHGVVLTRTTAVAWSIAVTTVHWTVVLYCSSFKSCQKKTAD
jgi:hypothetical protein